MCPVLVVFEISNYECVQYGMYSKLYSNVYIHIYTVYMYIYIHILYKYNAIGCTWRISDTSDLNHFESLSRQL